MAPARKQRLMRVPASVRMAGYTIPVIWVPKLSEFGDRLDGLWVPETTWLGPAILIDAELEGKPAAGDTFIHELVEAAAMYTGLHHDQKSPTRFTHTKLTVMSRFIWEALTTAHYPRKR